MPRDKFTYCKIVVFGANNWGCLLSHKIMIAILQIFLTSSFIEDDLVKKCAKKDANSNRVENSTRHHLQNTYLPIFDIFCVRHVCECVCVFAYRVLCCLFTNIGQTKLLSAISYKFGFAAEILNSIKIGIFFTDFFESFKILI